MRIRMICIALAGALVLPGWAKAQDEDRQGDPSSMLQEMRDYYGDEAFITIATGSRKPVYRAPAVATVITAEEIKAMGATTLDHVLEAVAGLHVSLSTQGRLDSVFSIRGIHTRFNPQVLVLMNGISFPHFGGGRTFQFRLPVEAISRIEVIRGPGSAVYGADAYSGVINIITKDVYDIKGTQIGGRMGSFDTYNLWGQHGARYGNWAILFSLEWLKTKGDANRWVLADFQSVLDNDPNIDSDASLAPGPLSTRFNVLNSHVELKRTDWKLRHWYWRQMDAGLGAGGALALDPKGGEDFSHHLIDLTYLREMSSRWELSTNTHYLHRKSDSRFFLLPPGARAPIGFDGNLDLRSSSIVVFPDGMIGNPSATHQSVGTDVVSYYKGNFHRLRFGVGIRYFDVNVNRETKNFGPGILDAEDIPEVRDGTLIDVVNTQHVFMPNKSRTSWYLSFQDEWQFLPNWELTSGVRYDHYSDFGATINPRVALVWTTFHNLTTKFLYGRAFRAPSFLELYSINNPVALGNPDLKPETIDTFEISFNYRPIFDIQTNLSIFKYKARNMIEFVPDENIGSITTISAQNVRDQHGYGLEFELVWDMTERLRFNEKEFLRREAAEKTRLN